MIDFTRTLELFKRMPLKDTPVGYKMCDDQSAVLDAWMEIGRALKSDHVDDSLTSERPAAMPLVVSSQDPDNYHLWVFLKGNGLDADYGALVITDFLRRDVSPLFAMIGSAKPYQFANAIQQQVQYKSRDSKYCHLSISPDEIYFFTTDK
jgi:hypothetical protein